MKMPALFEKLSVLYEDNGFHLYLVGGTSRDLLLGKQARDLDFATDATPSEASSFVTGLNMTFARFGSVSYKEEGVEADITTFRKEGEYTDHRHPKQIEFVRDMQIDSLRRDFTINAIYIDSKGKTYDFHNGIEDLKKGIIRFIGDPKKRIQEDPLRILRAERFARTLQFEIEESSLKAIEECRALLNELNPEKIKMELKKG